MKLNVVFLTLLGSTYAASSECGKGIYKTIVPLLKNYQAAQKYCAAKFPISGITITTTKPPTVVTTTAVTDQTSIVVVTTTVDAVLINKRAAPSRALNP